MKKTYLIALSLLFFSTCKLQAQVVNNEEGDNDETEITVTNAQGKREVIDLPEAMTMELDSLMQLYNTKTYLRPDTSCNLPDINPVYDIAVYKKRLSMLPTIIEMPYNDVVQQFIDRYSGHLRRSVSYMLGAQNFYMPIFEEALESYGLPLELKYLPVIESALNPRAVSRVGATGLWQFMYATGKSYGLEVNNYVDERSDPIRATKAAAKYLNELYKIFGDWDLVLAAYNSGPGNVTKAIRRSGGKTNYWNLRPYLPKETAGYVPAFLATLYIFEYAKEHGFQVEKREKVFFETDTVQVKRHISFKDVGEVVGMTEQEIEFFNPSYSLNIVPYIEGKNYGLRLPVEAIGKFVNNEDIIYAYLDQEASKREKPLPEVVSAAQAKANNKITHKVKKGETLGRIASRYGVTVNQLKKWNKIRGNSVKTGQRIVIHR